MVTAPVKSFPPNKYGLYDIAGNVWEWTSDWYRNDYYEMSNKPEGIKNPQGPQDSFDPVEPYTEKKVQRGGFLLMQRVLLLWLQGSIQAESEPGYRS